MANGSALVLVGPEDTIDTVIQRVQDAHAGSVQLLVTEGAPVLQTITNVTRLKRSAESQAIALLLITSDAQTLNAARLTRVDTMSVQGTQVNPPPTLPATPVQGTPIDPYSTRVLPARSEPQTDEEALRSLDDLAAPVQPAPSPAPTRQAPTSDDALRELDDLVVPPLPAASAGRRGDTPVVSDEDLFAALEAYDAQHEQTQQEAQRNAAAYPYDDDLAVDLAASDTYDIPSATPAFTDQTLYDAFDEVAVPPPPTTRVRPEDIALSEDERVRATALDDRPAPRRRSTAARSDETEAARRALEEQDDEIAAPVRKRRANPLAAIIPIVVVLALLAIGAYYFLRHRATVTVTPPQPVTTDQTFDNLVMPLNKTANASDPGAPAVQAIDVSANVVYTTTGTVSSETSAPRNPAKGTVTLYNASAGAIGLPQGTEFIGTNGQGQEVRFTSDDAASIPASTTARQGAQIITNLGQAQIAITARAPGSASNIDANKITQIAIPGQQPVPLNGTLSIDHGPITGGDEQQIRVVTDADVQQILAQALTGMNDQGQKALQDQATQAQKGWKIDTSSVTPSADDLKRQGQDQAYDLAVTPPVGTNVDPASPNFTVTVRSTFKGLATPANAPLPTQLEKALPAQLASEGKLPAGLAPTITGWHWDGSRLTTSGVLKPDGAKPSLDAQTRTEIIEAILGKSHVEAQQALEDFKRRGVISAYTLPDVDTLPKLNAQLDLRVEQ